MNLQITSDLRIRFEGGSYQIETLAIVKTGKNAGGERWEGVGYYGTLESAATAVLNKYPDLLIEETIEEIRSLVKAIEFAGQQIVDAIRQSQQHDEQVAKAEALIERRMVERKESEVELAESQECSGCSGERSVRKCTKTHDEESVGGGVTTFNGIIRGTSGSISIDQPQLSKPRSRSAMRRGMMKPCPESSK